MRLRILFLTLVTGCSSFAPEQRLNPAVYYKNDICFSYGRDVQKHGEVRSWTRNKIRRVFERRDRTQIIEFCGVGVLPSDDRYNIKISHNSKLDFFAMNTCHREVTTESPDRGIFKKDGVHYINYQPTLELGRACPLYVAVYNREGKHGWGIIAFENEKFKMPSKVSCNGDVIDFNGVSICESRHGLLNKIEFDEEVIAAKPVNGPVERDDECPSLPSKDGKTFEFTMPKRECLYGFIGKKSKQWHQFYTIGYEQLVVRGE